MLVVVPVAAPVIVKVPATFVIDPVPVTLVALANVMPWLLRAASLKPEAPCTLVASAAVNPL